MERIKFITDTASDIPDEYLTKYSEIELLSFPIAVDGREYLERKSFTIEEYYPILNNAREIPVTSRIPLTDFLASYQAALDEGYRHGIVVTINAGGSGTFTSAAMARDLFYEKNPGAREAMEIHLVDSRTYTMAYGYPIVESVKMARAGAGVREILDYLEDWVDCVEVLLGCYTLEFAKKSGRIPAAAAFVGDVLGLRPVILMVDGQTKTIEKVRGDKNLTKRLYAHYQNSRTGPDEPVFIVRSEPDEPVEDLQRMFEADIGRRVPVFRTGAAVLTNTGTKIVAIVSKNARRHPGK